MDIREHMDGEVVKYLVQRAIFCPRSGKVLDVRTCVIIRDQDGDPNAVLSPEGWDTVDESAKQKLAELGYTVQIQQEVGA